MKGELTDIIRLHHILDAIYEIETYLEGISFEEFEANSEKRFATIKQIEIVGEACNYFFQLKNRFIKKACQVALKAFSDHEPTSLNIN